MSTGISTKGTPPTLWMYVVQLCALVATGYFWCGVNTILFTSGHLFFEMTSPIQILIMGTMSFTIFWWLSIRLFMKRFTSSSESASDASELTIGERALSVGIAVSPAFLLLLCNMTLLYIEIYLYLAFSDIQIIDRSIIFSAWKPDLDTLLIIFALLLAAEVPIRILRLALPVVLRYWYLIHGDQLLQIDFQGLNQMIADSIDEECYLKGILHPVTGIFNFFLILVMLLWLS